LVPARWVVVVPYAQDVKTWAEQVCQVWQGLSRPELRVFLPPGQSAGHFQNEWTKHNDFQGFTVVLD
jgi:hypothetical protein